MGNRRLGADDGTVLFACSYCGVPARYPTEMQYTAERLFMCFRHRDTTTNLEEARKQGRGVRGGDEISPRFPIGAAPLWYTLQEADVATASGTVNGTTAAVTNNTGSMTASRVSTGVYTCTIPTSLVRDGLLALVCPRSTSPMFFASDPVSTQTMRVRIWNASSTLTDTTFDVFLYAV